MMLTLTIISFLLTMLYMGVVIWRNRELPESISALVYELPRQWQWIWIVWLVCDAYIAEDKDEGRWYDKKGVLIAEVLCTVAVFGSVITKSLIG